MAGRQYLGQPTQYSYPELPTPSTDVPRLYRLYSRFNYLHFVLQTSLRLDRFGFLSASPILLTPYIPHAYQVTLREAARKIQVPITP